MENNKNQELAGTTSTPETDINTNPGCDIEDVASAELSPKLCQYLIKRHGTLYLDPMPSADPADPLNWPSWKVNFILVLSCNAYPVCGR
jgi:hypothetical protein